MPDTVNEAIRDLTIKHQVDIERFKGGEVGILLRLLAEADAEVAAKIAARLEALSAPDRERMLRGEYTTTRLEALRDALAEQAARAEAIMLGQVGAAMTGAAEATVAFQARAVTANVVLVTDWVTPGDDLLRAVVRQDPFDGDGRGPKLLAEMAADWSKVRQDAVRGAIRQGIIQGEGIPDIMRRIRGTRSAGFKDGALSASRTTAERIARTGVSHVVNRAREETFKANADIIRGVTWVTTLDTRACPLCLSYSGKVYPVGEGPRPPQPHPSCRCTVSAALKRSAGPGTRYTNKGDLPGDITADDWFARQTRAEQDEILGPARAKLWRKGGLKLNDGFVDKSGREFTLDELRRRVPEAFERAGL